MQLGGRRALNPKRKYDSSKTVWSPDEGKTIQFRFRRTDLVTYTESTLLVKLWDSQSSVVFIDELTPNGITAYLRRNRIDVNGMEDLGEGLLFHRDGDKYVVDSKTVRPQFRIEVDKKISTQVRKRLRPFLKYVEARRALECIPTPTGSMRPSWQCYHRLSNEIDDQVNWPSLYSLVIALSPQAIHREFVFQLGGVEKIPLPLGVLPTVSVYDGYTNL